MFCFCLGGGYCFIFYFSATPVYKLSCKLQMPCKLQLESSTGIKRGMKKKKLKKIDFSVFPDSKFPV